MIARILIQNSKLETSSLILHAQSQTSYFCQPGATKKNPMLELEIKAGAGVY